MKRALAIMLTLILFSVLASAEGFSAQNTSGKASDEEIYNLAMDKLRGYGDPQNVIDSQRAFANVRPDYEGAIFFAQYAEIISAIYRDDMHAAQDTLELLLLYEDEMNSNWVSFLKKIDVESLPKVDTLSTYIQAREHESMGYLVEAYNLYRGMLFHDAMNRVRELKSSLDEQYDAADALGREGRSAEAKASFAVIAGYKDSAERAGMIIFVTPGTEAEVENVQVDNTLMAIPWNGTDETGLLKWHAQKSDITKISFLPSLQNQGGNAWDVSEKQDGSIMAWLDGSHLFIGANGKIYANEDSRGLFDSYINVTEINFGACFDTSKTTEMYGMFKDCKSLRQLDLSNCDTSNVTNMEKMFAGCRSLAALDLSSFDTSKVMTDEYGFGGMRSMFDGCDSLTALNLSSFDTGKITNMSGMFFGCANLKSLDLSSFDTGRVTNMSEMFFGCANLTALDLSSFDTSKVTNMNYMFKCCESLTALNLSSFDTSKVTVMSGMFFGCVSLTYLDLSSFSTINVTDHEKIFDNTGLAMVFEDIG